MRGQLWGSDLHKRGGNTAIFIKWLVRACLMLIVAITLTAVVCVAGKFLFDALGDAIDQSLQIGKYEQFAHKGENYEHHSLGN